MKLLKFTILFFLTLLLNQNSYSQNFNNRQNTYNKRESGYYLVQSEGDKRKNKEESKLALEIPLSISKNFILREEQLKQYVDVREELSHDFGIGLRYSVSEDFKIRFGIHHWSLPINPSYEAIGVDENNNNFTIKVEEESHLKNTSIYFHVQYEQDYTFFGGGVNIGIANSYKSKASYYDSSNRLLFTEETSDSLLTDEFNNQNHIEFIAGLKFETKSNITLKPFAKASIPFVEIYDSGAPDNTAYDMFGGLLNVGLIVDIGLDKK